MDLWYHEFLGHPLELPIAAVIVGGLFLLIRKTDPSRSRLLVLAASCLAAGPIHWILTVRLTQRIIPPLSVYLVMFGLLLAGLGFVADARLAIWLRVSVAIVFATLLTLALLFWLGAIGPNIAI